ncbi:MAG TPA: glycosyltransferase family 4 protein [Anaerovoracaceae bacterium]|nr:glycosyltransferase family 4 protein [Anaerovoracaceae bacterium]
MNKIRVGLQQRVIPSYRVPFIQTLASHQQVELYVFAGHPRPEEMVSSVSEIPDVSFKLGRNIHILKNSAYFCYQPELMPWIKALIPQVLILEANPRYPSTRHALKWMRANHKGLIGWGLGVPDYTGSLAKIRNKARFDFLNQFHAILAYSNQGRDQYIDAGLSSERVFVAPNATAAKPVGPAPERSPQFINGKATLIYVGRLQSRKKIDSLINACSKLQEKIQPNLWIVGEGQISEDLITLAKLKYPATKFWGALYGDELKKLYLQADLFVLPGTGGLAIQEAMSFALPVIVAEADGSQSNLVNDSNGWIIPPDDELALLNCIHQALLNPLNLRKMGLAAYEVVTNQVNVETMAGVFVNVIEQVYKENPST